MKETSWVEIKAKSQEDLCKKLGEVSLGLEVWGGVWNRNNWLPTPGGLYRRD